VSPFKAVLFDLGDTLIRLAGTGDQLLLRAASALGVAELDPAEASAVWQRVLDQASTPEELAKGRDLSTERHREVWTRLYADAGCERLAPGLSEELYTLTASAESWEAFPATLPTLRALRDRTIPVGVISDTGFDFRPTMDRLGISPFVDVVVMSFQHGVCKPAPKLFLTACEQLGVEPRDTLMVGDNPLTDGGGIAAGLHVVLLPPSALTDPRGLAAVLSLVGTPFEGRPGQSF
jgi:HAD superfamily hydrolase (TIGR01509 family)